MRLIHQGFRRLGKKPRHGHNSYICFRIEYVMCKLILLEGSFESSWIQVHTYGNNNNALATPPHTPLSASCFACIPCCFPTDAGRGNKGAYIFPLQVFPVHRGGPRRRIPPVLPQPMTHLWQRESASCSLLAHLPREIPALRNCTLT